MSPSAIVAPGSPRRYRFGTFELEFDERRLIKDGVAISLRPRAFDLLAALVDRAGHLVTKNELLDNVWPKMVVEETAVRVQLSALRKVLGADAIATVSGQGYRFALPVTRCEAEARISTLRHNLPYHLTSFIGREQEIARLKELVIVNRLVTLIGAGGVGKTRLAIEAARLSLDAFHDGVWLVELAGLSDPQLVPQAAAQALTLRELPGRSVTDVVSEHLSSKRVLLVVDNAEHVLEGCVLLLDEILRRGPDVAAVVTSRERLGMTGELTWRVPTLTVPGANEASTPTAVSVYEGVRLFVERAKLARPDFELTPKNVSYVASICVRLDGMPLAIELAAPRLRSMSIGELSQRLDQRFALLTDGSRASPPRHRTLRSTIDWSYDLLTEHEQAMMRRLSVFAGGWTLASAERVCAGDGIDASAIIDQLTWLVDKSLVVTDEQAGATRYRVLETVRQYALDRLRERDEEALWRARHVACFLSLAETFSTEFGGPQRQMWLARIASEHDNLRAALAWSAESSPMEGLRLAAAMDQFWRIRGHLAEGRQWLARLLDAAPTEQPTRERAAGLFAVALLASMQGDHAAGKRQLNESLTLSREIDDPNGVARVLSGLAWVSIVQGDYPEAEALAREAVAAMRATGKRLNLSFSLDYLAIALHEQGQWAAAREFYEQALVAARELGTPWEIGDALNAIAWAECDEGHCDLALTHFAEGIGILHRLGNPPGVMASLEGLACLAAATAAPRRAARLWGAAEALRQEIGGARAVHMNVAYERHVQPVRATLTTEAFDQAWNEGRAMSLDDAVRYALDRTTGREA
jgi:predicted ATPase/DNA-binding winged helix-turn-helix (wHTH) protein